MLRHFPTRYFPSARLLWAAGLIEPGAWYSYAPDKWLRHARAGSLPESFAAAVTRSVRGVPFVVPKSSQDPLVEGFQADWILLRHHSVIAVDSSSRRLAHVDFRGAVSLDYELQRTVFSNYIKSPPFSVISGRIGVVEECLMGRSLAEQRVRPKVLTSLADSLVRLTKHEKSREAGQLLERICLRSPLSAVRSHATEIVRQFGNWPLVPTHGDIALKHIYISNGEPSLIDFGDSRLGLPFEDVLAVAGLMEGDGFANRAREVARCAEAANMVFLPSSNFFRLAALASKQLEISNSYIAPDGLEKRLSKWDKKMLYRTNAL